MRDRHRSNNFSNIGLGRMVQRVARMQRVRDPRKSHCKEGLESGHRGCGQLEIIYTMPGYTHLLLTSGILMKSFSGTSPPSLQRPIRGYYNISTGPQTLRFSSWSRLRQQCSTPGVFILQLNSAHGHGQSRHWPVALGEIYTKHARLSLPCDKLRVAISAGPLDRLVMACITAIWNKSMTQYKRSRLSSTKKAFLQKVC